MGRVVSTAVFTLSQGLSRHLKQYTAFDSVGKKIRKVLLGIIILNAHASYAELGKDDANAAWLYSQHREPEESYQHAYESYKNRLHQAHLDHIDTDVTGAIDTRSGDSRSAYSATVPLSQLDVSKLPLWNNSEQLLLAFKKARDKRFIQARSRPMFPRRSSWLYPDDGCFARAALAGSNLETWGYPAPKKVFIFGNLRVATANHPHGSVTWWYHVVPIQAVKVKDQANVPYVMDPAIEPRHPLTLSAWVATMTPYAQSINLAICDTNTYEPNDRCFLPTTKDITAAKNHQQAFLDAEWMRLVELRRNPESELGDTPPWKTLIRTHRSDF